MQESMKETKTPRYCKLFLHVICVFSAVHGAKLLYDTLEAMTQGLTGMIIMNVWSHNRAACASSDVLELKQFVVGASKLLTESPVTQKPEVWGSLFKSILALVDAGAQKTAEYSGSFGDEDGADDEAREFDNAYSKLAFASVVTEDPLASITSTPAAYFANILSTFTRSAPGQYTAIIQSALDQREAAALQALLQANNAPLA